MAKAKNVDPSIAEKLRAWRGSRERSEIARLLNVGKTTVSNWELRQNEPGVDMFEKIANLTPDAALRQFFLSKAGSKSGLRQSTIDLLSLRAPRKKSKPSAFVDIPLLANLAGGGPGRLSDREDIVGEMRLPRELCPNPRDTACIHIRGESMQPLIHDGALVAVDVHQVQVERLIGKIVAAQHNVEGLVVKKLMRHQGELHLVSINPLSGNHKLNAGWRVVGRVIWWTQSEEPF